MSGSTLDPDNLGCRLDQAEEAQVSITDEEIEADIGSTRGAFETDDEAESRRTPRKEH